MQSNTHLAEGYCYWRGADVTMKDFSPFLEMGRCNNWAHKIFSRKYLSEDLFCQFPQSTEGLIPDLHLELFQGVEGQQLQQLMG